MNMSLFIACKPLTSPNIGVYLQHCSVLHMGLFTCIYSFPLVSIHATWNHDDSGTHSVSLSHKQFPPPAGGEVSNITSYIASLPE